MRKPKIAKLETRAAKKAAQNKVCCVCGTDEMVHKSKPCWEFGANSFEASDLFVKRMKRERQKASWETVGIAFRAAYSMVNGRWLDKES